MKSKKLFKFNLALLLLIILLGFSSASNAQNTWQYAGDYKAIIGLYDSQHFTVDDGNRDYKYTTDGGATLQNFGMSISSPRSLTWLEYLSTTRMRALVFTGSNFELHESTNGGASFSKLSDVLPAGMPPLNVPPKMVSFDNLESLFSCRVSYNSQLIDVLLRTTDGGNSWNLATTDTFAFGNLYAIEIYKDGHVMAASNFPQGIEISTDRGQTFTPTASFPPLNSNMTEAFDGNQNLWVSNIIGSQNADSYHSTDGGATWNSWSAMPEDVTIRLSKPTTMMVFGSTDTTAISKDNGSTFSTVKFPATKPAGSVLRLRLGDDQQTYYIYDGNAKLWTFGTGSGMNLADWQGRSPVEVYPNPASDQVFLKYYEGPVEVYSASGQLLKGSEMNTTGSLDISGLPSGLLILKLNDGFKKFIKY